jgi:hypothetical protein
MKISISKAILIAAAILLCTVQPAQAQQKIISPSPTRPEVPEVSVFISGNYFGPKLNEVNSVYNTIENEYALPSEIDFKNYYFILAGLRFSPTNQHAVQAEFGGSILKSPQKGSTNFLQEYYGGGSYLLSLPVSTAFIYAGGGLGCVWLNTERTYASRLGVAQVNAQLGQIHGILGIEFFTQSGVSISFEGRYSYATAISPLRSDLDFTLKGISGGIQIGVPIIM